MYAILACCFLGQSAASDAALRARFEAEYPGALARSRESYGNLRGSATYTEYRRITPAQGAEESRFDEHTYMAFNPSRITFDLNGPLKKVGVTLISADSKPEEVFYVAGPKLSFECRSADTAIPYVTQFSEDLDSPHNSVINTIHNHAAGYLEKAHSIFRLAYAKHFPDRGFIIDDFAAIPKAGKTVARIKFKVDYTDAELAAFDAVSKNRKEGRITSGWMDLLPEQSWLIDECHLSTPAQESIAAVKNEFDDRSGNPPMLKTCRFAISNRLHVFSIRTIAPSNATSRDFTTAAFNLPDLMAPTNRTRRGNYLMIISGVLLLGLVAVLRSASRHLKTKSLRPANP